jgi:hypothetical protein
MQANTLPPVAEYLSFCQCESCQHYWELRPNKTWYLCDDVVQRHQFLCHVGSTFSLLQLTPCLCSFSEVFNVIFELDLAQRRYCAALACGVTCMRKMPSSV